MTEKEEGSAREARKRLLQILHKNRFRRNPDSEEGSKAEDKEKKK